MSQTVLVTGCFGFIGSNLVESLLKKKYHVIGIGNPRKEKQHNFVSFIDNSSFELLETDIMRINPTQRVEHEIDTVFHLATNRNNATPIVLTEINVTGTVNILEFVRQNDIKKIVFSSSAAVYGVSSESPITEKTKTNPQNVYAASKLSAEKYIQVYHRQYGIKTAILRLFNVYGPKQAKNHGAVSIFINQAMKDESITLEGNGSYEYTPIYVSDLLDAIILASKKSTIREEIINIGGPEIVTIGHIAQRVIQLVKRSKSKIKFKKPRPNWGTSHIGSIETMKEILDFVPRWSLDEGLNETITWYEQFYPEK
ncbi:MAG: NAD-dependent epimerase/dehydratase family protein [Candidatus Lokiarchaeota archaeon]|nr:NAD-dependent epimerase/dehydratase family protein [Candidatus Lokiarchaeota archaeon]